MEPFKPTEKQLQQFADAMDKAAIDAIMHLTPTAVELMCSYPFWLKRIEEQIEYIARYKGTRTDIDIQASAIDVLERCQYNALGQGARFVKPKIYSFESNPERMTSWIKELERGYDRVLLVTTDNQIIGQVGPRTPRKLKKKLKKAGDYEGRQLRGFPINKLLEGNWK